MFEFKVVGRLGPALIGGCLVALLAMASFASRLPVATAGIAMGLLSAAIAFGAPSRAKAWRRVLLLAALLSFASAWAVGAALLGGIPEAVQSNRSENAQGLSLLVLLGGLALLGIVPAFFVALGLVLGAIAYFVGRESTQRDALSDESDEDD